VSDTIRKLCFYRLNAPHTHSGNPWRKNCAVQDFNISSASVVENCAGLGDCSGGRMRMKKRFWITVQFQTSGRPECVWRCQFSLVESRQFFDLERLDSNFWNLLVLNNSNKTFNNYALGPEFLLVVIFMFLNAFADTIIPKSGNVVPKWKLPTSEIVRVRGINTGIQGQQIVIGKEKRCIKTLVRHFW
jgi:hypothetical protein